MKYFVVGDVHGCLLDLEEALQNVGFDKNNENHTLISLGDNFDRGGLARGMYKFLTTLPRAICLKGNHELILEKVFERGFLTQTDCYNGTNVTIASFAKVPKSQTSFDNEEAVQKASFYPGLRKWLAERPYYFETKNYIFTHGWLPDGFYDKTRNLSLFSADDWFDAVWTNTPISILKHRAAIASDPSFKNKTIVVGHWHTWRLRQELDNQEFEVNKTNKEIFDIWEDTENKIVVIDGCTPYSKKVNVFVVEDEEV